MASFSEMFAQLRSASGQSRPAKTVEWYGWLTMMEGGVLLLFPHFVASLLRSAPLHAQAADFLRMLGVLVAGIGMLYTISGRMNAEGFVFATLLDRPFIPPIVGTLRYLGMLPGAMAVPFAFEDFGSWLWTLTTWRAAMKR